MSAEHCPHLSSGSCSVCQRLAAALADVERLRGQRDRLAAAAKTAVQCMEVEAALTPKYAAAWQRPIKPLVAALEEIARHP
jgi:hypothetical protein